MHNKNSGEPLGPSAPKYIVEPIDLSRIDVQYVTEHISIIDFGISFFASAPPAEGLGTPYGYLAPEVIFDKKSGFHSDIWALACTIFEIRAGVALFEMFSGSPYE